MSSGGEPPRRRLLRRTLSINEGDALGDLGQKVRGVQPAEPRRGVAEDLPNEGSGVVEVLEALRGPGAQADGGERRLDDVRRPQVFPMRLREAVEDHELWPDGTRLTGHRRDVVALLALPVNDGHHPGCLSGAPRGEVRQGSTSASSARSDQQWIVSSGPVKIAFGAIGRASYVVAAR